MPRKIILALVLAAGFGTGAAHAAAEVLTCDFEQGGSLSVFADGGEARTASFALSNLPLSVLLGLNAKRKDLEQVPALVEYLAAGNDRYTRSLETGDWVKSRSGCSLLLYFSVANQQNGPAAELGSDAKIPLSHKEKSRFACGGKELRIAPDSCRAGPALRSLGTLQVLFPAEIED